MRFIGVILIASGLVLATSCMKQEDYSDIPEIEFSNWVSYFDTGQFATRGAITILFRDGNGDIGLNPRDTFPPYNPDGEYYYNYVITYFEKRQGVFVKLDLNPPYSARIPVLTPDYPGKAIKGIIADTLDLNPKPLFDTIRFELFIYDRSLNKSNIVTTPEIILRRH
jgi:hypothetical protein